MSSNKGGTAVHGYVVGSQPVTAKIGLLICGLVNNQISFTLLIFVRRWFLLIKSILLKTLRLQNSRVFFSKLLWHSVRIALEPPEPNSEVHWSQPPFWKAKERTKRGVLRTLREPRELHTPTPTGFQSCSVFSLAPDLLFDSSRVREYANIRIVLQFKNSQFKLWLRMWWDLVRALVMFMVWLVEKTSKKPTHEESKARISYRFPVSAFYSAQERSQYSLRLCAN